MKVDIRCIKDMSRLKTAVQSLVLGEAHLTRAHSQSNADSDEPKSDDERERALHLPPAKVGPGGEHAGQEGGEQAKAEEDVSGETAVSLLYYGLH